MTLEPLTLAYSPCPNDTYIFHAWVHGLLEGAPLVREVLDDIDALNAMALRGEPDVVKLSFHALAHVRERYALLHAGGALGRGCGPLLVVRDDSPIGAPSDGRLGELLEGAVVAIPGDLTTAALLVRLYAGDAGRRVVMPFDRIMTAVASGEVEVGAIIHESRFTYRAQGLRAVLDLGDWWEETTGLPVPLGGIAVRRDLGAGVAADAERAIRRSLDAARSDPDASAAYIRRHAQEMDPIVCREHIALYVNQFSADYGLEGGEAIRELFSRADAAGIIPAASGQPLFWNDSAVGASSV